MNVFIRNGKIVIDIDPDDAEELRFALQEFVVGFVGSEKFPFLDKFINVLENGIESTLGLPIFPPKKD